MEIPVRDIEPNNIGAIVSFEYDPNGKGADDPDLMQVMGTLDGVMRNKKLETHVLVVAGQEFEFSAFEKVDLRRSNVLSKLHKFEVNNQHPVRAMITA